MACPRSPLTIWRNRFIDAGKAAKEDGTPGKAGARVSLIERCQRAEIQELTLALAEATVQMRIWQTGSDHVDQVPSQTLEALREAAQPPVARLAVLAGIPERSYR